MKRKGGILVKLPDNRKVIVYHNQPLQEEKGKIILNLVDDNYRHIIGENDRAKILIWDLSYYNLVMEGAKLIGYVD